MNKNIKIDPNEFDANYTFLRTRHQKTHYFRNAITNLIVLLSFIGFLVMVFGTGYLGMMGFSKQIDLIECVDYQNLEKAEQGTTPAYMIEKCSKLGVEIK